MERINAISGRHVRSNARQITILVIPIFNIPRKYYFCSSFSCINHEIDKIWSYQAMESTDTRLSDQIARTLQRLIHDRQLKPGDRLPSERALAEQLGVSRPPVREAIRTPAGQGLLTTRRGGGTYLQTDLVNWPETRIQPLAGLLQDDIHYRYDVLEARHTLESDTAWYAALRATQQDKDNIR